VAKSKRSWKKGGKMPKVRVEFEVPSGNLCYKWVRESNCKYVDVWRSYCGIFKKKLKHRDLKHCSVLVRHPDCKKAEIVEKKRE
jgi:hypothetical protein